MYHPYFRGKMNELLTIREKASLLAAAGFAPLIEPVKDNLNALDRALAAVMDAGGSAIVIVNPVHGEHGPHRDDISQLLSRKYNNSRISPAILLTQRTTVQQALACVARHPSSNLSFVHAGFFDAQSLISALPFHQGQIRHIFIEGKSSGQYVQSFSGTSRVIVRDSFDKQNNSAYPPLEVFSDLHLRFRQLGATGFGDFLTMPDDFSAGGGPAWAVAIHLTYIDPAQSNTMMIRHFVSDTQDTPTDPAGKFAEALRKLVRELNNPNTPIREFAAAAQFRDLHARGHFPGLGAVKKLSMQHHIEALADHLGR